jgi:outer membrane protein assembly factor BamB
VVRALTARCCGLIFVVLFGAWPALAQAPDPEGAVLQLLIGGTLDLRWLSSADDPVAAAPGFDERSAYVPFTSGRLVALDLDTGRTRWTTPIVTDRTPAIGGGLVFVAVGEGVRALRADTGDVAWERAVAGTIAAPPYWDTGWLVLSFEGGDVAALRAADGEPVWRVSLGAIAHVRPAPALDVLYFGLADGRVVALDLATGNLRWSQTLDGAASGVRALADQLVVGTAGRTLHSLDLRTGRQRWRWRIGAPVVGIVAADDSRLYVVAFDHVLRAIDRRSGNLRWRRAIPHRPAGSPVLVGAMVVVPTLATELSAYDAATGAPALAIASAGEVAGETHFRVGGPPGGTRLLAVSVEGRLLAFGPRIEPPPAPLEGLPGAPVPEPPLQPAAGTPPGGASSARDNR